MARNIKELLIKLRRFLQNKHQLEIYTCSTSSNE